MTAYRLYFLDTRNHILGVEILDCDSDAQAIEAAGRLAPHRDFELWDRDRLVARLVHNRGGGARSMPSLAPVDEIRARDFLIGFTSLEAAD